MYAMYFYGVAVALFYRKCTIMPVFFALYCKMLKYNKHIKMKCPHVEDIFPDPLPSEQEVGITATMIFKM